jgi:hypothetical protein
MSFKRIYFLSALGLLCESSCYTKRHNLCLDGMTQLQKSEVFACCIADEAVGISTEETILLITECFL